MRLLQSVGCMAPVAILLYGVVGVLLLGQYGGKIVNYAVSMDWDTATGTIVSSEVEDASDTTGERYLNRVVYTYIVDGATYQGDRIDLRGPVYLSDRETAERLIAAYPVGAAVQPYVDPSDPTRAVLDRSVQDAVWWLVATGAVLVALSLGLGVRYVRGRRVALAQ